ncbi:RNA polymerase sigma factor [candidate division KSB1 bacterium]|nr:RNA polymerase sigma factor [candidate division KSB1 bacterium]
MHNKSDNELMVLVVQRKAEALKVLYHRYEHPIYNFIYRYTGCRELAQDLLQETFTRVWLAASTFGRKKGSFKGWLFTIALNITRSEMIRKQYAWQYTEISSIQNTRTEPVHPQEDQPDKRAENADLKQVIFKALGELPNFLREIIILKHYQQLKFREIAEITKTPEGTLKARFHRAIARLEELLHKYGIDGF